MMTKADIGRMTLQRIPLCSFSRRLHLDTATDEYAVSQADLDSTHHFIYNSGKVTGTTSVSIYENPFRQIDVSSFPLDLQQRLQQLPIMTQIAILKDPALQQKYFPEYCYPNCFVSSTSFSMRCSYEYKSRGGKQYKTNMCRGEFRSRSLS